MTNFDSLKNEIQAYLEQNGFGVYFGYSRSLPDPTFIDWDTRHYPDYKLFLDVARQSGVKLIVLHHHEFSGASVEEVAERLQMADLPREEKRSIERRLEEIAAYKGFTCSIELSFDHQGRTYIFDLHAPWYDELEELSDDIDEYLPDDEDSGESPMGGYFSRN